jgi:hypothetical protein
LLLAHCFSKRQDTIGTANAWAARKSYVLKETFTSMDELIKLAKSSAKKSLATMRPKEIVKFEIKERNANM